MLTGQQVAPTTCLPAGQNLVMFGRLQGLRKAEAKSRAAEPLDRFDLAHAADRSAKHYRGACAAASTSRAVWSSARRWCPSTSPTPPGSPQPAGHLGAGIRFQGRRDRHLLTTQYLEEADSLSDRIIGIDKGTIIAEGTADRLK